MLFSKKAIDKTLIFIIGSGRSGTHLLGRTVGHIAEVEAFIEDPKLFKKVTDVAINPNRKKSDIKKILKLYNSVFRQTNKSFVLEKTHPNIWLVEEILDYFETAKFIGIKRNVYATIASMLNHKGVLEWYNILPLNQVNPFLGITEKNYELFKDLPLESKCALRWKSHYDRLTYLETKFPENVLVVDYEDFYNDYNGLMIKLERFLKLENHINSEALISSNIDRWKSELTDDQIKNIDEVLEDNYTALV
ncbi:sulfotransferase family protein [Winogradskyella schleiferi]|uniref:sulfotransferase family protein n=1 Tax=Winogradskyella schleiferi TaxID=2686078 RepID=UPI0015C19CBE|nr:sulfotransferase [Winogradskyella schleiferi]